MIETRLDRLKKDHTELQYYLKRLERDGDIVRIPIVHEKLRFLVTIISKLEEQTEQ